jgi:hypothetical protein
MRNKGGCMSPCFLPILGLERYRFASPTIRSVQPVPREAEMTSNVSVVSAPDWETLRRTIHERLCRRDRLDPGSTPLATARVKRCGRTCGYWFEARGPRAIKAFALWVGDEGRVLFYNSAGERVEELRLSESPDPANLAA